MASYFIGPSFSLLSLMTVLPKTGQLFFSLEIQTAYFKVTSALPILSFSLAQPHLNLVFFLFLFLTSSIYTTPQQAKEWSIRPMPALLATKGLTSELS
jgi:hypothetical protein